MLESTEKFSNPETTAKGETRAWVDLNSLDMLWFNTGTQCNLSCGNCYIESSPTNDRLALITEAEVTSYLDEIKTLGLKTKEIGLTGGEPFLNKEIIGIIRASLERGFETLVLTNAYRLMNRHKEALLELNREFPNLLIMRVSLDHFTAEVHEAERGEGTFEPTMKSIKWLFDNEFQLAVAGRTLVNENADQSRKGYEDLMRAFEIHLNTEDSKQLVIFPEMSETRDVPEITTECWGILNKSPDDIMCANSRMVVKRTGEDAPKVLSCTLLAYDPQFEMGTTLKNSKKSVALNHKFCAQFCVLGGASCS